MDVAIAIAVAGFVFALAVIFAAWVED